MKWLFAWRQKLGLTQLQLGNKANIDPNMISRYERDTATPSLENVRRLALALGITVDELLKEPKDEQIKITLSYDWEKMKEAKIDMTGNEFTVCLGANGEIGLNGAMKFTSRETIKEFLAKIAQEVEIAFDAQVKRGVIQEV